MDPGKRDQRIAVYSDVGTTVDGVGQHQPSWSLVGSRWAEVRGASSKDLFNNDQVQSQGMFVVTVLADSLTRAIDPFSTYFIWRSRRLNPLPGVQPNYRDLEISFQCIEGVTGA